MASDADKRIYLANNCDAELAFQMDTCELDLDIQYRLVQAGYNNLRKLAGIDETRVLVRTAFTAVMAFDVAARPNDRLHLSLLTNLWEGAKDQLLRESQLRAESKASRLTPPISLHERNTLKRVFELRQGRKTPDLMPSVAYISEKLEEIELGEPKASRLDEVTCEEDAEVLALAAQISATGQIQVTHKKSKVSLPSDPESFRARLHVEANLWLMLAVKFVNKHMFADLVATTWTAWTEYFLGKKVYSLKVAGTEGAQSQYLCPPWAIVLSYEYECRKEALRLVREEGKTLNEALLDTMKDAEIRELHFISAVTLAGRKRASEPDQVTPPNKWQKGKGKGKGNRANTYTKGGTKGDGNKGKAGTLKGKGKGKSKGKLMWQTPDKKDICFAYSSTEGCPGNCNMVHCCRVKGCAGPHPTYEHKFPSGAEADS
jgi:hypothetical protein